MVLDRAWWHVRDRVQRFRQENLRSGWGILVASVVGSVTLFSFISGVYVSTEPDLLPVQSGSVLPAGLLLVKTTVAVAQELYDKPGGYLSNDKLPPGVFLDDMPNWEQGVLVQVRVMVHSLNHDFALSRAQYIEDPDLAVAETAFAVDSHSWIFPPAEHEFRRGVAALQSYGQRLQSTPPAAGFYVSPDALHNYLDEIGVDLGKLSTQLNAALPQANTQLSDALPVQQTTSWWRIDDEFYQARGQCWALVPMLRAMEVEYGSLLKQHHADLSLRAAIHELEATQQTVWSPVILNGSGFGVFANHSLTLANYIDRAHLDLQDVQQLLSR